MGDALDTGGITAAYNSGVLRLTIPVAERAKPRKITVSTDEQAAVSSAGDDRVISATAEDRQPVSA